MPFPCFILSPLLTFALGKPAAAPLLPLAGQIKRKAQNAIYDFDMEEWDNISDLAKDLITKLIVKDPEHRLDSAGLLRHPWFLSTRISNEPIAPNIHRSLSTFQNMARSKVKVSWRRLALLHHHVLLPGCLLVPCLL